jgi:hypothetical protein
MTIGSFALQIRSRLRGGLHASFYREVVRPRILRTAPVVGLRDGHAEIHVLTSAQDWLDLIWGLKSFYRYSGRRYRLAIHDDGTLGAERIGALKEQFPEARIIDRAEADALVLPTLAGYPRCLEFRRSNHLAPKVFDFVHYLTSDRILLLDSDVLFFAEPTELLRRIEDPAYSKNSVNRDIASAYTVEPDTARAIAGVELGPQFNSGLGLIHRASLQLRWLEEFLGMPGIIGHFWRIEQTLFALSSYRFGCELLPTQYDVRLTGGIGDSPSRHYVGAIRDRLYSEGLARLVRQGFLKTDGAARWED